MCNNDFYVLYLDKLEVGSDLRQLDVVPGTCLIVLRGPT